MPFSVAPESNIYEGTAYPDYAIEEDARLCDEINLIIQHKSNSKRKDEPWIRILEEYSRKRMETNFGEIKNLFLRKIHTVTFKGFLRKQLMFTVAFTFNKLA